MNLTQLHCAMALQVAPHIGDIKAKKLIQHCGSPEAVFKTSKKTLQAIGGVGSLIIKVCNLQKFYWSPKKSCGLLNNTIFRDFILKTIYTLID